jgi:hypothetical protein
MGKVSDKEKTIPKCLVSLISQFPSLKSPFFVMTFGMARTGSTVNMITRRIVISGTGELKETWRGTMRSMLDLWKKGGKFFDFGNRI